MSLARTLSRPAGITSSWPANAADSAARLRAKVAAPADAPPSRLAGCGIGGAGSQFAAIAAARPAGSGMSCEVVPSVSPPVGPVVASGAGSSASELAGGVCAVMGGV